MSCMVYSKLPNQQHAITTLQQQLDHGLWPTTSQQQPLPLEITANGLVLHDPQHHLQALHIDYLSNRMRYRQSTQNHPERLAQAIKIKHHHTLTIWDLTAGLGMDGYQLAHMGHRVTLIEQHPLLACMVQEAIERAQAHGNHKLDIQCHHQTAAVWCTQPHQTPPDIITLDPMFPQRKKSAAVSEPAKWLHQLVGSYPQQPQQDLALLRIAQQHAQHRVVVKRPVTAPPLANTAPSSSLHGKRIRYDIYCTHAHHPSPNQ